MPVADARKLRVLRRIIPGNWGKVESGWLVQPLLTRSARSGSGGIIHQFLCRRSRAVSNAKRNRAARNDEKPFRAESSNPGWFRVRVNRSYPEGNRLLLRISTERTLLPASSKRAEKTPKGGTKEAFRPGRKPAQAWSVEHLKGRRCYKRCRWLVSEKQPQS
jgi:hypothetical protein